MFKKIITYFIILAVVLPIFATVVPIGGGVKTAYAANSNQIDDPCNFGAGDVGKSLLAILSGAVSVIKPIPTPQSSSVWHCALFTATWVAYAVGLKGSVLIAGWASDLFNLSIQFSLSSKIFDVNRNPMIEIGWTMVRDLFNLIFIFILLYAAISTILQYGNMDIKKILPGLIIAALLVNFSLMISKVVIDASHVFSFAFYERINTTDNGRYAEFKSAVEVNEGFKKKNLADVFLAGFNPQSLLTGTMSEVVTKDEKGNEIKTEKNTESQWYQVVAEATKKGDKFMDVIWKLFMIIGLESALAIFSAFILIVVASMFVVRIVVLWMLMIFSPIAFLGFILPNMNKYSKKWWDTLISQSFFAPAFLFMFMLSTEFVNSKIMQGMLNITPNDATKMIIGMDGGGIVTVIFNFLIIGALMWFSLSTAKSMGGYSAEFAQKGRDFLLGGANKMLWKPARYGLRYGGGAGADKILGGKGRISGILKSIPGVGVGLRKLGSMKKADEKEAEKKGEKYASGLSDAGYEYMKKEKERGLIARVVYGGGVTKATRKGYENVIKKKKTDEEKKKRIEEEEKEIDILNKTMLPMKKVQNQHKARVKDIEKEMEEFDVEIKAADYELAEAVKSKDQTRIDNAKINLKNVKQDPGYIGLKAEKKVREEKIKTVDKLEEKRKSLQEKKDRRGETEGLQSSISKINAGGSGGSKKL